MTKDVQAKNIADSTVIALVESGMRSLGELQAALAAPRHGEDCWDCTPAFPPKVVQAKLRAMVKRGVLSGCACGCRGDFQLAAPPTVC